MAPPPKPPHLPGELAAAYIRRTTTPHVEVHEMFEAPRHPPDHHISEGTKVVLTMARTFVIAGALIAGGWLARDKVASVDNRLSSMVTKQDFDTRIDSAIARATITIRDRVTTDVAGGIYDRVVQRLTSSDYRTVCPAFVLRGSTTAVCKIRDMRTSQ